MVTVHIEVDVYSGRPNPAWDLASADVDRFRTLLAALPRQEGAAPPADDRLGYRGVRATVTSDSVVEECTIGRGVVTIHSNGSPQPRVLHDADRALEKWLLRTGQSQLRSDLLDYLIASQ